VQIEIRDERPNDIAAIRDVHTRAFGQTLEADIVDALRAHGAALGSLVACVEGHVAAHVLYSPASVGIGITGAALGPMAVLPEYQRQGIGSRLIGSGNERIRHANVPFIVVVGHPEYYPRFGFRPASRHGLTCEWDVPDPAFMVLVLDESKMREVSGQVTYRREFSTIT